MSLRDGSATVYAPLGKPDSNTASSLRVRKDNTIYAIKKSNIIGYVKFTFNKNDLKKSINLLVGDDVYTLTWDGSESKPMLYFYYTSDPIRFDIYINYSDTVTKSMLDTGGVLYNFFKNCEVYFTCASAEETNVGHIDESVCLDNYAYKCGAITDYKNVSDETKEEAKQIIPKSALFANKLNSYCVRVYNKMYSLMTDDEKKKAIDAFVTTGSPYNGAMIYHFFIKTIAESKITSAYDNGEDITVEFIPKTT